MSNGIEDNRGELGRETTGGSAGKQDTRRHDGDRDFGARQTKREQDGEDRGDGTPSSMGSDTPSQYSGMGGSRTDDFGARSDQPGNVREGWREVGVEGDAERLGGEDERPG